MAIPQEDPKSQHAPKEYLDKPLFVSIDVDPLGGHSFQFMRRNADQARRLLKSLVSFLYFDSGAVAMLPKAVHNHLDRFFTSEAMEFAAEGIWDEKTRTLLTEQDQYMAAMINDDDEDSLFGTDPDTNISRFVVEFSPEVLGELGTRTDDEDAKSTSSDFISVRQELEKNRPRAAPPER
jgi:hypothetical protein